MTSRYNAPLELSSDEWALVASAFSREVSSTVSDTDTPSPQSPELHIERMQHPGTTPRGVSRTLQTAKSKSLRLPRPEAPDLPAVAKALSTAADLPALAKAPAKSDLPTSAEEVAEEAATVQRQLIRRGARSLWNDYIFSTKSKDKDRATSGVVRQARCAETGRRVTVKSSGAFTVGTDLCEIIAAGMDIHRRLDHEHIVKVEQVYMKSFAVHMVMEFLEGGDLCSMLRKRGRFTEEEAKGTLRQVLQAVDHLHQRNIVHRDLKLESILFAEVGGTIVKLIDFGLATEWDGVTPMSLECSCVEFCSPEMLRGSYTQKTDMWSVGAIAYMLLTGEPLYHGSAWEIHARAKAGKPLLCNQLYKCSAAAQDLVFSLLERNPERRLGAAEALHHPWLN